MLWRLWLKGNFSKVAGWRFTNYTDCIHKYIPKCMTLQGKWWDTENWWVLDFSLSIPAIFFSKRHVCTSGWRGKFRLKGHLSNHDSRTKTRILFKTYWIDISVHFICFYRQRTKPPLLQVNIQLQDLKTASVEISRNGKVVYVAEFTCLPYHSGCSSRYQTLSLLHLTLYASTKNVIVALWLHILNLLLSLRYCP